MSDVVGDYLFKSYDLTNSYVAVGTAPISVFVTELLVLPVYIGRHLASGYFWRV